jgi:hypothetical protein
MVRICPELSGCVFLLSFPHRFKRLIKDIDKPHPREKGKKLQNQDYRDL